MPRKGPVSKRPVVADPVYGSPVVSQLVNKILLDGKKSLAEQIVYGALEGAKNKSGSEAVVLLKKALDNVRPTVEVRSRRVGGATYQIPVEVKADRRIGLAMRWLIAASTKRSEKGMIAKLAAEMCDALEGRGEAVKKRIDTQKMADANQAFAHFA